MRQDLKLPEIEHLLGRFGVLPRRTERYFEIEMVKDVLWDQ